MLCCLLPAVAPRGLAQGRKWELVNTPRAARQVFHRHDTLVVRADSVVLYNAAGEQRNVLNRFLADSLRLLLGLRDSIDRLKDSVIAARARIDAVQERAYAELRARFEEADTLARQATRLTDEALRYARRARLTGYLTAGMVSGVAGGLLIKPSGRTFGWGGFLIGALAGGLLNYGLQRIVR